MQAMTSTSTKEPDGAAVLSVDNLAVRFKAGHRVVYAVNGVSVEVGAGECVAIVGESGSGKSATALSILGLLPAAGSVCAGSIRYRGTELVGLDERALRGIRGKDIAMVFQDPSSFLNPVLTVGEQVTEVLREHLGMRDAQARLEAKELLERVGIAGAAKRLDAYPHQMSGGMKQRAMIAIAIACRPSLVVADEPTTALDVSVQAQILELLADLQEQTGMALLLISHNLGVVAQIATRVCVMYAGRVVEDGACDEVLGSPTHPYTAGLVRAVPRLTGPADASLTPIPGSPPDLEHLRDACAFYPRCARGHSEPCDQKVPVLQSSGGNRSVACYYPIEKRG